MVILTIQPIKSSTHKKLHTFRELIGDTKLSSIPLRPTDLRLLGLSVPSGVVVLDARPHKYVQFCIGTFQISLNGFLHFHILVGRSWTKLKIYLDVP